ncbi:RNA-directed DNA polymerase, eukaryota [Tanacetum coccineum]
MSTQQDIYDAGSENRPPMLNKDNYIPWSSRLLRYAKSKSNGKLLVKSILEGPYQYRMIEEADDPDHTPLVLPSSYLQSDDELTSWLMQESSCISLHLLKARSNVDHTRLISKSIFVTNFPDNTTSKDLWEVCKGYGTVVDVFIPDRKSKAGKRFAFVRFIKVDNVDRLVGNLCTLWIGRMHLHANVARFDRPPIQSSRPNISTRPAANGVSSFTSVLKGNPNNFNHIASSPAMVLDDECVVERDLDNFVMGEVKDFSSINNLRVLLSNEGFQHVRLAYLGGLWVMIELTSVQTKMRFMKHVGVASWFSQLCKAQPDFVSRERIVWIDIEGVPLHAWSRPTFSKIGSRWGEVIELEDNKEDCFARKRICIKTKLEDNILEKFKIIVRGKNFVIRAKELFVWSPTFNDNKEVDDYSEDDSVNGAEEINGDISKQMNLISRPFCTLVLPMSNTVPLHDTATYSLAAMDNHILQQSLLNPIYEKPSHLDDHLPAIHLLQNLLNQTVVQWRGILERFKLWPILWGSLWKDVDPDLGETPST